MKIRLPRINRGQTESLLEIDYKNLVLSLGMRVEIVWAACAILTEEIREP
jgi:hypothetical protein